MNTSPPPPPPSFIAEKLLFTREVKRTSSVALFGVATREVEIAFLRGLLGVTLFLWCWEYRMVYRSGIFWWRGLTLWAEKHRRWSSWAAKEVFPARWISSGSEVRLAARIFFEEVGEFVNKKRLIKS